MLILLAILNVKINNILQNLNINCLFSFLLECNNRKCATCVDSASNCTETCFLNCATCTPERHCITCKIGFYLNSEKKCIQCPLNCHECDNANTCTYCKHGENRNLITPECGCEIGFYDDNSSENCV